MEKANRGPTSRARPLARLIALALLLAGGASAALALPALGPFARRHGEAVVRVLDADGKPLSTGFFVATVGYAAASLPGTRPGDALVVELRSGARRQARVVMREDGGSLVLLAVKAADDDEVFPSLRLQPRPPLAGPGWLIALCHDEHGHLRGAAGGLRRVEKTGHWRLDLPCGAGAPVLEADGVVTAFTVRALGRTASLALPVSRLIALSRDLPRKRPEELPSLAAPDAGPPAAP